MKLVMELGRSVSLRDEFEKNGKFAVWLLFSL